MTPAFEQHVRRLATGSVWPVDEVSVQLFVEEFDRRGVELAELKAQFSAELDRQRDAGQR